MANLQNIRMQKALEFKLLYSNKVLASITDDAEAMQYANLYPVWQSDKQYQVGDIISYGLNTDQETQLYRVVQAHSSQAAWTPDTAVSLFTKIGFTEDGTSIWTQPTGAHDAYMKGDIVGYNGKKYKSTVDNNVYAPSVITGQWEEIE